MKTVLLIICGRFQKLYLPQIFFILILVLNNLVISAQEIDTSKILGSFDREMLQLSKNPNLYDIIQLMDKQNVNDTTEGSFYMQMKKAEILWHDRLFPTGQSLQMATAITEYVKKFNSNQIGTCNSQEWSELGPIGKPINSQGVGQIHTIKCSPNYITDKVIYAASNWGGLWKRSGTGNWTLLNTDIQLPFTSVSDIAIDPTNTQNLYITTGDSEMSMGHYAQNLDGTPSERTPLFTGGVYRSTNGGVSWQHINGGSLQPLLDDFADGGTIRKILIHPTNNNILYIASSKGVYKCSNATASTPTWVKIFTPLNDSELKGLEFKPNDPSTLYVSGRDIYRTQNNGTSWFTITGSSLGLDLNNLPNNFIVGRINVTTQPNSVDVLFAYIVGTYLNGSNRTPRLYIYKFNGVSWTQIISQNDGSGYKFITPSRTAIAASPLYTNSVYYGREVLRGRNDISQVLIDLSGYISNDNHPDIHALTPVPGEQKLFVGTDGGVHIKDLTQQNSSGWTDISSGLAVKTIYRFDDSNDKTDRIIIGNQDTGTDVFMNGNWSKIDAGDGYNGKIDDKTGLAFYNANFSLYAYDWNNKYYYEDKKPTDPTDNNPALLRGTFQMKNHPASEKMIFSHSELYERKKHEPALVSDSPNTLWDLRSDVGKIVSAQWQRQLTEFDISPSNPNFWLIGLSGHQRDEPNGSNFIVEPKLLKSTIGGCAGLAGYQNSTCFTDITQNLINSGVQNSSYQAVNGGPSTIIPVITSVVYHPENHLKAWVTFTGYEPTAKVWGTNDGGNTWFNADPNGTLNNLPVNDIVFQKGTNDRLYIGTDAGLYFKNNNSNNWTKFCNFPNVMVTELKINYCMGKLRACTFGRGVWEGDLLGSDGTIGTDALEITSNITWNASRGIDRNIRVKAGGTLNITGATTIISIPKDGKIIIEQGGVINITDAKLTNNCGKTWKGIDIWGNNSLSQTSLNQGVLILNNATIEHAEEAIAVSKDGGTNFNGGIVQATNSNFFNNKRSVAFYKYDFQNNNSFFTKCNFKTDANYRHGLSLLCHLSMWAVKGVTIRGCNFETTNNFTWDASRVGGIVAVDANFTVTEYCSPNTNPCPGAIKSTFKSLHKAINTSRTTGILTFNVYKSIFQDNVYGIITSGNNNFNIRANSFTVGKSSVGSSVVHEGVSIFSGTGFNVDQNTFTPTFASLSQPTTIGIRCTDTGNSDNEIYKNTFSKSSTSNNNVFYSNLANGTNRNSGDPIFGLKYYCNANINNIQQGYDFAVTDQGISNGQGSLSFPARNTFSLGTITSNSDFNNGAFSGFINYYHRVNITNEIPFNKFQVNNFATSGTGNSCYDRYGGIEALTSLDEGNYEFLESTIVEKSIKLGEAKVSNNQKVIENIEQDLIDLYREKFRLERDVIQYFIQLGEVQKLISWYSKIGDLNSKMSLIDLYIYEGDIINAESHVLQLLGLFGNNLANFDQILNFVNLKTLQINALKGGRDILVKLNNEEKAFIESLAKTDRGVAGYYAMNILNFHGEQYFIDPVFPENIEWRKENNVNIKENSSTIFAYPNPGNDFINFSYNLSGEIKDKTQLQIVDFMGNRIQSLIILSKTGEIKWDCSFVPTGVYYYNVISNDEIILKSKPVIVIK